MKLIRTECVFDGSKMVFYFFAEGRVDFRDLVRDLAQTLHTRIEMKQIGDRDETKLIGGVGPCGRELCCSSWLREFQLGVGEDGQGAGPVAEPVEARRHVRPPEVLPALRVRHLPRARPRAAADRQRASSR